jgi:hypothetical protein
MSTSPRSSARFEFPPRPARLAPLAGALFLLACAACEPEEKYGGTVPVGRIDDNDPATDPDPQPSCPRFDARYRDRYKSCSVDADCEIVTFQQRCSAMRAYAVARAELEAFFECAPQSNDCDAGVTAGRTEDGRSIGDLEALTDVHARCVEGMCEARVETRSCGSTEKVCGAGEICVSSLNDSGGQDYQCAANPCLGEVLDCSCAESVCKAGGRLRVCAIDEIENSDVYCKVERR